MSRRDAAIAGLTSLLAGMPSVANMDDDEFVAMTCDDRHSQYAEWLSDLTTQELTDERASAALDTHEVRRQVRVSACDWEYRARQATDRRKLNEWNRMAAS